MKLFAILPLFFLLSLSADECSRIKLTQYKGRLEVKGICMNYTIKLLEGNMDTSKIVATWKDEVTGKTHTNVFALGSVCSFPSSINEGDEFYFSIDPAPVQNCAVCMAYYPKPSKSLAIKVTGK